MGNVAESTLTSTLSTLEAAAGGKGGGSADTAELEEELVPELLLLLPPPAPPPPPLARGGATPSSTLVGRESSMALEMLCMALLAALALSSPGTAVMVLSVEVTRLTVLSSRAMAVLAARAATVALEAF